ncbi:MAG TPA: hypothetical protein VH000_00810, partial [Rhizomicrobium sp.]|nr:hypothetical protein [Rhizomicrobium sp.]
VRVFAFDNDDWITADLANYKDTGHIFDDRIIEFQLKSIASGSHILTKRNVGAYINTLRARVVAYQLKNSRLGIQNGRPR